MCGESLAACFVFGGLDGEEAAEKAAIALQGDAKILGRDIITASPLALQYLTFVGKYLGDALDSFGD